MESVIEQTSMKHIDLPYVTCLVVADKDRDAEHA